MLHNFTIIIIAILLGLIIQHIDGFDRVIVVSESDVHVISYDETSAIGSGSGSHVFDNSCCIYDNCSCPSLYNALANLTSDALINITTDVVLSSIIPLVDLANIVITGHNNPTVNCNDSGGLNFISCCNCTIEGITWNGCGAENISNNENIYPVLQLFNSSNITITSCLFQHSIGQAVVLSEMIGEVNIDHCSFSSNKHYEGHGTAIHYSSNNMPTGSPVEFMITDCKFLQNENAKSVAYFDQSSATKLCENLNLQNSIFNGNKGVPVYLSNKNLHIHGNIEFYNNIAENGGGIFISNHSKVTFHKSATVNFTHNRVNNNGGAISLTNHSSVVFEEHPTTLYQCHNNKLYDTHGDQYLAKSLTVTFYNNAANGFGQDIYVHNSNITVGGNANVTFNDNCRTICTSNAVYVNYHCTVIFEGNSTVTFGGYGGIMYIDVDSTITFQENSAVTINSNSYYYGFNGGVMYISDNSIIIFQGNSTVKFMNNFAYNGGVMYIGDNSIITFQGNSTVKFMNNYARNGRVIYIGDNSIITFQGNSTVKFMNNYAHNDGVIYISDNSIITFQGNSTVKFMNNFAYNGGVMYISDNSRSNITFQGNSTVTFGNNYALRDNGGVMYISDNSIITFQGNSTVKFMNNYACNGGVMYISDFSRSNITFQGNSTVIFDDNHAGGNGGVMYISDYSRSNITFQGNSTVKFMNNYAHNGGVIYINDNSRSNITFKGNSTVTFGNNDAPLGNGGVMYISDNSRSNITFQGNSTVTFDDNHAGGNGGVMYIWYNSIITFQGNSTVIFDDNHAGGNGGVMYISDYSRSIITFQGNSTVTFGDNHADDNGGVMYISDYSRSNITFQGNSTVTFGDNHAGGNGGVMYNSIITFQGNSTVTFGDNHAGGNGGVMYTSDYSKSIITFQVNCTVTFTGSGASKGGIMYIEFSTITFQGNSTVKVYDNQAVYLGGAMFIYNNSAIIFKENSKLTLNNNTANLGGVMYIDKSSTIGFEGNSIVTFTNNRANGQGGAIYIIGYSTIAFKENSEISFCKNKADDNGGSLYVDNNSSVEFRENSKLMFNGNTANLGGSIFSKTSSIIIDGNSFVKFIKNTALRDGGAIYLSDYSNFTQLNYSNVTFYYNSARDYGGAVYVLLKGSSINFNSSGIYFINNTARTAVYIHVQKDYENDSLILNRSVNIGNNIDIPLATSPNKLILHNPAKCINDDNTDCDTYYMNNIMLGQEITFDACLLDYYDQPTEAIQFLLTGMNHQDYTILGRKYISISCNHTTQGISVIGNLQSNKSYNYSVNISLYVKRASEFKFISVNLIVELSQCQTGFWYSNESQQCECYNADNIISCSGSNSTIKRGYWFGNVKGKPTVTSCPNGYCNFTCCEITNGVYHLSPVRANQCRPHRFGTACGNCEKDYTLSFDSPECVKVNKCTIGTALVTTLSLLYWIAVVVAVFAMTYFEVTIGSLYAIVYYYSVMDILLSRVLFISNGLYTTVSIMSSLAKLTPQFLGQLCLARNMSGIDQQFIHYVHPMVVLFILIMISVFAKRSRRVSSFISRGIIHFICFLLLLSYTSVASTSLLLMRPLTFVDVDKVYTYLSPDIEYFHGRHSAYVTVAIMFTIVIVFAFPLLLLFEPFLNSKINFIKIKPLLDQFQGCYKDKYRCFAGYYMICRLVIILIVIINISHDFTTQYLLISTCALMQLIHVLVRPYASTIHNIFDGIILQLIVIISVLPIVEFVDNYDETFVLVIIYLLVILPLTSFITIKFWINRNIIQNAFQYLINICSHTTSKISTTRDPQEPAEMREFDIVVDDSMRTNATIADV